MRIFYLDTSSSYLFAGISQDGNLLGQVKEKLDKELSSFTLPKIEELFSRCKLTPQDIDKIIVVYGPGSFTGVRIGITIAKIYAWSLKKEIAVVSSLDAMACSVVGDFDYIVPMIDARRGYVYGGIYTIDGIVVLKGSYMRQEALEVAISDLPGKSVIVTNDGIDTSYMKIAYDPDILKIILRFRNQEPIHPHAVEPEYLKRVEAEEKKDGLHTE